MFIQALPGSPTLPLMVPYVLFGHVDDIHPVEELDIDVDTVPVDCQVATCGDSHYWAKLADVYCVMYYSVLSVVVQ